MCNLPTTSNNRSQIKLLSFAITIMLFTGLYACGGMSNTGNYTFSENSKRIKLNIGDIKEINVTGLRDSTWQVIGSSENKEIVDVTSKQDPSEETTTTTVPDNGKMVFLVKGVTTGSVSITFAEKQKEQEGPGRVLKTYQVQVVTE